MGQSYKYNSNGTYRLLNSLTFNVFDFIDYDFTGYHYTCLSSSDTCDKLYYLPFITMSNETTQAIASLLSENGDAYQEVYNMSSKWI